MTRKKNKTPNTRYRMADVVRLTGVGREAIHFYIGEGLLPAPVKTSRNMAWYCDQHIELVKAIRVMQQEQFLPLKAIKAILHGTADFKFTDTQLKFFSAMRKELEHTSIHPPADHRTQAPVRSQVSAKHIRSLKQMGWIEKTGKPLRAEDEEIIRLWASFLDQGLGEIPNMEPKELAYIMDSAEYLFEHGIGFYRKHLSRLTSEEAAAMVIRCHPLVVQLFSILYERRVKQVASSFPDDANDQPRRVRGTPRQRRS